MRTVRSSAPTNVRRRRPYDDNAEELLRPPVKRRGIRWERVPVTLFGVFFLLLWWAAGGKYTIDGLPLFFNTVFAFFHAPFALSRIGDWHWYVYLCWLPIAISVIERRNRPRRGLVWSVILAYAVGVWLIVCMLDLGSTWLAVTHPLPDAFLLSRQVAQVKILAGIWTGATTFLPEIGMAALWRYVRG